MGKKIVVITSSFRKDGNSTALAEAFIEEAQKKRSLCQTLRCCLSKYRSLSWMRYLLQDG